MKRLEPIPFTKVTLDYGFWQRRQQINAARTIYAIYERFRETGRFDALDFNWKPGDENRPHIFWDSDIAKWIEAACHILVKDRDDRLLELVEGMVDRILLHQDPSGYYNIWFTVGAPDKRWTMRTEHELYCAGHWMEAALAYQNATGKDRFLQFACRFADHIEQVFVKDRSAAYLTPGHEEVELALVKLYQATGERRYLDLARHFIDNRGSGAEGQEHFYSYANARYTQDHLPPREQRTAEGHAVRATYLYSAMADVALEYGDMALADACRNIFDDIVGSKMYITGGIGSSCSGEAFTIGYDLPNLTAYTESCAAIGLALFAGRMFRLDPDGRYADTVERILYNGFLSSISLEGDAFFYENPLEIDPRLHIRDTSIVEGKSRFPAMQRLSMFRCACCPPNISRFIGFVGDTIYSVDGDTVYVHQYMANHASFEAGGGLVDVEQHTDYPMGGTVAIRATGMRGKTLALRVPGWCRNYTLSGAPSDVSVQKGYAHVPCREDSVEIGMQLDMAPCLIEANPNVQDDAGRVALQRGPLVYCLEEADNGGNLRDVAIDPDTAYELQYDPLFNAPVILADGSRRDAGGFGALYLPAPTARSRVKLRFIPYFGFANRGQCEMILWVQSCRSNQEQTAKGCSL